MSKERKAGRPEKPPGERYKTPARQLGRVADDEWAEMQAAAQAAGKSFTEWAVSILLRAARRRPK